MILSLVYKVFIILLFLALLPVVFFVGLLIFLFSGRPIFYAQKRVGKDGLYFTMYKFRTMIPEAEQQQIRYRKQNEAKGPVFKIHDDPRFTAIGSILSHTGLDELPQIFNILKGEMAIIGPRPLPVYEVNKLTLWQRKRNKVKPGIISTWIVDGYHTRSFNDWMKSDLIYAEQKNLWFDTLVFIKAGKLFLRLVGRELKSFLT